MTATIFTLSLVTLLGTAIIGGVFFAFSNFVMPALEKRPVAEGMAAMQSINITVLNPLFLVTFMGTAPLSLLLAYLSWTADIHGKSWIIASGITYNLGTFLVTIAGNVPLNERLAKTDPSDGGAEQLWRHYLVKWTSLNTIRTIASLAATLMLAIAIAD
jgi:uncharacterized membrane protein